MHAHCLSIHAGYRCAHSGVCCTTPWPIPIEPGQLAALQRRGLPGAARSTTATSGNQMPVVGREPDGRCVFFDDDGERLCGIHRDAGPDLMPSACRNFPRVALRDPRGTFITLSHFCPTAARRLLTPGPLAIVEAPSSLSLDGTVEGLDASHVMPPLLRPGMLMDLEGYDAWEREGISVLDGSRYSARLSLSIITAATEDACAWRPGPQTLAERVSDAYGRARDRHVRDERNSHPPLEYAVRAFLAAHLLASGAAYQDGGLMAIVKALEAALEMLYATSVEPEEPGADAAFTDPDTFIAAARAADLRLRHARGRHVSPRQERLGRTRRPAQVV
jgi:Fe-S-cluster containining protein